jgi:hypothetical protein
LIQLHQVTLRKAQLDRIPEAERRLFVLIAHAANEVNALAKLFHFAASSAGEQGLISQAENAQALILARTLSGKLYEFWQLLQTSFFGAHLSKSYEPLLEPESLESLRALKRYFAHENLIATLRNKFAFHYSPDQIDAGYRVTMEGDPLDMYLGKHHVNTFYAFADSIAGRALLDAIRPGDHQAAFAALIDETSEALNHINQVIGGLLLICFRRYLGENLYALGAKVVEIEGVPESQKVAIPYFIELDK